MRPTTSIAVTAAVLCVLLPGGPAVGSVESQDVLWSNRYDGVGLHDQATDVATTPTGTFVTGWSEVVEGATDYATVGYDSTGGQMWESRFHGRAGGENVPTGLAVTPNGGQVLVTGESTGLDRNPDYATVAYNASTGAQRWVRRVSPDRGEAVAMAIAVSPDGAVAFVTGWFFEYGLNLDYLTLAYDTLTGTELWRATYAGPAEDDVPQAIGVSPDGSRVFVTGGSVNVNTNLNFATVAYDAATGEQLWVARYAPNGLYSGATDLAVSPDGTSVYVTGFSPAEGHSDDYATLAYRASDGARLWVSRFDYAPEGFDRPHAIAVSPGGGRVFVTGESGRLGEPTDFLTIAMNARTGVRLWRSRFNGPAAGMDVARDVGVDATGIVYVTGESEGANASNFLTIAYDPITGAERWISPQGTVFGDDMAVGLAVGASALYVTGGSQGGKDFDFLTVAYAVG